MVATFSLLLTSEGVVATRSWMSKFDVLGQKGVFRVLGPASLAHAPSQGSIWRVAGAGEERGLQRGEVSCALVTEAGWQVLAKFIAHPSGSSASLVWGVDATCIPSRLRCAFGVVSDDLDVAYLVGNERTGERVVCSVDALVRCCGFRPEEVAAINQFGWAVLRRYSPVHVLATTAPEHVSVRLDDFLLAYLQGWRGSIWESLDLRLAMGEVDPELEALMVALAREGQEVEPSIDEETLLSSFFSAAIQASSGSRSPVHQDRMRRLRLSELRGWAARMGAYLADAGAPLVQRLGWWPSGDVVPAFAGAIGSVQEAEVWLRRAAPYRGHYGEKWLYVFSLPGGGELVWDTRHPQPALTLVGERFRIQYAVRDYDHYRDRLQARIAGVKVTQIPRPMSAVLRSLQTSVSRTPVQSEMLYRAIVGPLTPERKLEVVALLSALTDATGSGLYLEGGISPESTQMAQAWLHLMKQEGPSLKDEIDVPEDVLVVI